MKRTISSAWTIPYKFLIPIVLATISLLLILDLFADPSPNLDGFVVITFTTAATVFFSWWGLKLKRVSLDGQNLYVSNWIREISIPLSEIDFVESLYGGWRIRLRLRSRSDFGRTIVFLATWKPFFFSRAHPIVEELRRLSMRRP